MLSRFFSIALPLSLGCALNTTAWAAPIHFGDFEGDTVTYETVLVPESSGSLFGAPVISGDKLDFSSGLSTTFEADSLYGTPDSTLGSINAHITAKPGRALTEITATASGFYQFSHYIGDITADTAITATARIVARITAVDGVDLPGGPILLNPVDQVLVSDNLADLPGAGLIPSWGGSITFDVAQRAAIEAGISGKITGVLLTLNTTLDATSAAGTHSQIALRVYDAITLTVPEPTSASLLLLSGVVLATRRRQRSNP